MKKFLSVLLVLLMFAVAVPVLVNARSYSDDSETCWQCGGSGNCSTCDGSGTIEEYNSYSAEYEEIRCPDCNGSGHCSYCGGVGTI